MTVRHRSWHFWVWAVLGPALVIGLIVSRQSRPGDWPASAVVQTEKAK
jgi:hypothetical protein